MISRSLIKRSANKYQITKKGFKYLERNTSPNELVQEKKEKEEEDLLIDRGKEFTTNQRSLLKEKLHQMDPFAFEELVKFLMEAMGYEDVEVTPKSRDKGVDVIGTIENGISSVKEVIQVKRFRKNINRDIVSQLRGDVPLFEAYRGTIITTSDFTKDAKESALDSRGVPITLINGDKLMDLLIRHKIGIIPKTIQYFLVDESTFNTDIEPT
ncbi:MAG: restriction endonuclease [Bacteroidota bacterium]